MVEDAQETKAPIQALADKYQQFCAYSSNNCFSFPGAHGLLSGRNIWDFSQALSFGLVSFWNPSDRLSVCFGLASPTCNNSGWQRC